MIPPGGNILTRMRLTANVQVENERAARYLAEICRELGHRARTKPELGVRVESTDLHGTVDFGWARCVIDAEESMLRLRVEADDEAGLRHVRELISRHLEKHADDDEPPLVWREDGKPVAESHEQRRDTLRAFHRRMRMRH